MQYISVLVTIVIKETWLTHLGRGQGSPGAGSSMNTLISQTAKKTGAGTFRASGLQSR